MAKRKSKDVVDFSDLFVLYKIALAQAKALQKVADTLVNRDDDEGEFVYLAHNRAARQCEANADELINIARARILQLRNRAIMNKQAKHET